MRFNLALFMLFIVAFSFLFASWSEDINVYAVDGKNRYVEGVNITVTYQKSQFPIYKDSGFDGWVSQKTNAQGYAGFEINNNVQSASYEIRYYYIEMNYGKLTKKDKVTCPLMGNTCHPNEYIHKFTLATNRITLNVKDQSGRAIEGALVSYNENSYTTGPTGKIIIDIPQNTDFVMVVDYGTSKRTVKDKMVKEDKIIDVTFNRYNIEYRIIDDENNPLSAEIILNDIIKQTDGDGNVLFESIIGNELNIFVRYEGGSREFTSPLNQDIDTTLVIDMTPPTISNVFYDKDVNKNVIFINCKVVDPNNQASGLRSAAPVKLRYKVGEMGWRTIEMYTTGKDAFQATIPYENNLINYEIEAIDAQDNLQKYNGIIEREGTNVPDENQTTNGDEPIIIEPTGGMDTNTLIIIGVIVLIIAFIGYKFYTGEI